MINLNDNNIAQSNQWAGVQWTALGTSITLGTGSAYTSILNTLFNTTIQNLGVGAATLSPAGSGNGNIAAQIPNISISAEIVSLELTNDFRLSVPLGTIADTTTATFYGALYVAVNSILTTDFTRKVLLIVPYGDSYGGINYTWNTPNATGAYWYQYCNAIRDTAKRMGVYCCDVATLSQINGYTTPSLFTVDGIHLNRLGANQFANTIYNYLLSIPRYNSTPQNIWTLNNAVISDLSGTRLTLSSINGSNIVQYTPPSSGFGVLWLATGTNNATQWEIVGTPQYANVVYGDGANGWIGTGAYLVDSNSGLTPPPSYYYNFDASGTFSGTAAMSPATNSYGAATKYRAARIGNLIVFDAYVSGSWVRSFSRNLAAGLDTAKLTNVKIGLLVYSAFMSVQNVQVGTYS